MEVGGPEVLTRREIAGLVAGAAAGPPPAVVPAVLPHLAAARLGAVHPRLAQLAEFAAAADAYDEVAPRVGRRTLAEYLWRRQRHFGAVTTELPVTVAVPTATREREALDVPDA